MDNAELIAHACNIRRSILEAGHKAGAMHFGGSLSVVEILAFLYGEEMRYNVTDPERCDLDRLIVSKGHCGLGLYAALNEFGVITKDQLLTVGVNGGDFPPQLMRNPRYGIEMSSGSLGLGLSFAIGQAISLTHSNVFALVGNGEANEGSFWEAVMFAGAKKCENLCVILDDNRLQLDGESTAVMPIDNWAERFAAFGWTVAEADGHNFDSLRSAFKTSRQGSPLVVVANTVKGKGVLFMENVPGWHHGKMTEEQYRQALTENGGVQ